MSDISDASKAPSHRIVSKQLTTCNVTSGGKKIRFDFVAQTGEPMSIEMSFGQAESLVMTIPQLLSMGLKMQTGDAQARYVFSVGAWSLEAAKGNRRILSIRTPDGFEVAFAMSSETSMAMGSALERDTDSGLQDGVPGKPLVN
ncbi:MAG: hypothetical protein QHD01_18790 [Bradyrhizobium sp.]|uniref:hypothetical protein n=1 Tax=Bradyrhizobium sp. TaxID=376 RepID=UPI0029A8D84B|nr:hypothetical protein [Bradyrhizobium sp.]MDX3968625.1 hypothetical protein [Bradyrhizobium sp.]